MELGYLVHVLGRPVTGEAGAAFRRGLLVVERVSGVVNAGLAARTISARRLGSA